MVDSNPYNFHIIQHLILFIKNNDNYECIDNINSFVHTTGFESLLSVYNRSNNSFVYIGIPIVHAY